jgi:hypothetical protein
MKIQSIKHRTYLHHPATKIHGTRPSCHNATRGLVLRAVDRTKGNVNECCPGAAEELQDDSPYYL